MTSVPCGRQGRVHEAQSWFVKALALSPTDPAVYQHYGTSAGACRLGVGQAGPLWAH